MPDARIVTNQAVMILNLVSERKLILMILDKATKSKLAPVSSKDPGWESAHKSRSDEPFIEWLSDELKSNGFDPKIVESKKLNGEVNKVIKYDLFGGDGSTNNETQNSVASKLDSMFRASDHPSWFQITKAAEDKDIWMVIIRTVTASYTPDEKITELDYEAAVNKIIDDKAREFGTDMVETYDATMATLQEKLDFRKLMKEMESPDALFIKLHELLQDEEFKNEVFAGVERKLKGQETLEEKIIGKLEEKIISELENKIKT